MVKASSILKKTSIILAQLLAAPVLILYFLASFLPMPQLYSFIDLFRKVGLKACGKQLSKKPLARMSKAFPNETDTWLTDQVNLYFRSMSWFTAEFLKDLNPFCANGSRCGIINPSVLSDLISKKGVIICYCPHCYNYERLTTKLSQFGDCDFYLIYNSLGKHTPMEALIKWKRSRFSKNAHLVPTTSMLQLYKTAKSHEETGKAMVIGILADIAAPKSQYAVQFLGDERKAAIGAEKMGKKFNADFLYLSPHCKGRNDVEFTIKPLDPTTGSITPQFFSLLEEDIRRQPYIWMLWSE